VRSTRKITVHRSLYTVHFMPKAWTPGAKQARTWIGIPACFLRSNLLTVLDDSFLILRSLSLFHSFRAYRKEQFLVRSMR
jgi:hypothetical protein